MLGEADLLHIFAGFRLGRTQGRRGADECAETFAETGFCHGGSGYRSARPQRKPEGPA